MKKISEAKILSAQTPAYWAGDRSPLAEEQVSSFIIKYSAKSKRDGGAVFEERLNRIYSHLVIQLDRERAGQVAGDKKRKASAKISTIVNDDIKRMCEAYGGFVSACEGLNEATKDFLTDQMIQGAAGTRYARDVSFSRCFDRTLDSFQPILEAAAVDIEIKKGQNSAALRDAIHALADLYHDMTGRKPSRVYDGEKIPGHRGRGETGHFHEFVHTFMDFVPKHYGVNGRSLAGHIRLVCDSARRMDK